jgi:hypothetical protein
MKIDPKSTEVISGQDRFLNVQKHGFFGKVGFFRKSRENT